MKLHYKSFGKGFPIIILHGLFGTLDNWQTIAKQLAMDYMVYIVDLRNHGRSPHSENFGYTIMAEDLLAFMEDNWIYQTHIIGHSMGGKTAMQFALNYPDLIEKLVIVDIATRSYRDGHSDIFKALFSLDLSSLRSRRVAEESLGKDIKELAVRQFLLKNLTRDKEGNFSWKMNLPIIHQYYPEILSAIQSSNTFDQPTLFLRGELSDYILPNDLVVMKQLFPSATLETVANAGHWIHAEAPKVFLEKVKNFLKK